MLIKTTLNCVILCLMIILTVAGADQRTKSVPGVERLSDCPGLENVFAVGTNMFSGSTPNGRQGFDALEKLGVKTLISVDGAQPAVDLAKEYGMRYVHLPIGYDGISESRQIQLSKAIEVLPGPIYVHCHQGKHRGPAAIAIIRILNEAWTPTEAEAWLGVAGTAREYTGLYASVRHWRRPTATQLAAQPLIFPERAEVSQLVEAMVDIEQRWQNLKAVQAAGYDSPPTHPDLSPANEALILREHYREAQRLAEVSKFGDEFLGTLAAAEEEAKVTEELLRLFTQERNAETRAQLDLWFTTIQRRCSSCHKDYRDTDKSKNVVSERPLARDGKAK